MLRASGGGVVLRDWSPVELADRAVELLRDVARLREMRRLGREYVAREHSPTHVRELIAAALAEPD
jgi:hypothetical protein